MKTLKELFKDYDKNNKKTVLTEKFLRIWRMLEELLKKFLKI